MQMSYRLVTGPCWKFRDANHSVYSPFIFKLITGGGGEGRGGMMRSLMKIWSFIYGQTVPVTTKYRLLEYVDRNNVSLAWDQREASAYFSLNFNLENCLWDKNGSVEPSFIQLVFVEYLLYAMHRSGYQRCSSEQKRQKLPVFRK